MLEITAISALKDNYVYLLRDAETGKTAVVDPTEAEPVIAELERRGLALDLILNTHHHWDHVGGNAALQRRYGCPVAGPAYERGRIRLDRELTDGDQIAVGASVARVLFIP